MIEKLACSLGRNDEEPNIALARELAKSRNAKGILEIVGGLAGPYVKVANDCIKVLYEIGARVAELISSHVKTFIDLLTSQNNRLVWGAMTALAAITAIKPREIFGELDTVVDAYKNGSVITVDNAINVFAGLTQAGPQYEKKVFPFIISHLENCRHKEVGQHAERASVCVTKQNSGLFRKALMKRYGSLTDAQKKRVDKLLKKIP